MRIVGEVLDGIMVTAQLYKQRQSRYMTGWSHIKQDVPCLYVCVMLISQMFRSGKVISVKLIVASHTLDGWSFSHPSDSTVHLLWKDQVLGDFVLPLNWFDQLLTVNGNWSWVDWCNSPNLETNINFCNDWINTVATVHFLLIDKLIIISTRPCKLLLQKEPWWTFNAAKLKRKCSLWGCLAGNLIRSKHEE